MHLFGIRCAIGVGTTWMLAMDVLFIVPVTDAATTGTSMPSRNRRR
jgi:hypothetical protein